MFSSALKSFTSNISSNYTIAQHPSGTSGPWKIFDAKRKQTGKAASVFVFDKKSLEPPGGGLGGRTSASSLKRAHEDVLERLKKEANSLARLRHPSILELAESVEETRNGGLMFATEAVTCSLAGLLQEKDEQERSGGRASRYVVEESDGSKRRRELEVDELEIQKGLLQLAKGLEFLHESAGLVHGNLTPDAVMVNAKGDWKISGLAFCGPHESSTAATSIPPVNLHEILNHDPRLPKLVQLSLDYTSPDFVLDNSLVTSADMFSLGLLIVALYNSPHTSPLSVGGSLSSYKRVFSSSSTIPARSNNFLVPSSHPLPPKLASELLPRLITRRAAQRVTAREFQEASYFDNILVSTIRFLDALPGKAPSEKAQFLRGLPRIMPEFPKSVLEKKVLPALLEEMKDKDLLAPLLMNIFSMVKVMPSGKRAFTEKAVPRIKEIFVPNKTAEKDAAMDAGLMVILENMETIGEKCSGKSLREDILPIVLSAAESSTHALEDAALSSLCLMLPLLDFSTIKNELFPVVANVFTKTSSLSIKIRGLEAFYTLCGGRADPDSREDDLNGIGTQDKKPQTSSSVLDRYTVQEKLVPLLKGIKTKEPSVMMSALRVFRQVGKLADIEFVALEVLPVLWTMGLGPLLDLQQFEAFMSLIKNLSGRIESEQSRKLRELSSTNNLANNARTAASREAMDAAHSSAGMSNADETDFETLVSGRKQRNGDLMGDWAGSTNTLSTHVPPSKSGVSDIPTFSWQTALSTSRSPQNSMASAQQQAPATRTVTPDLASFVALTPSSQYSRPLQPSRSSTSSSQNLTLQSPQQNMGGVPAAAAGSSIDWSAATTSASSSVAWNAQRTVQQPTTGFKAASTTAFSIPPPPSSTSAVGQQPSHNFSSFESKALGPNQSQTNNSGKSGLDKYESLL